MHIQTGLPPMLRLGGVLKQADAVPITDDELHQFLRTIAPPRVLADLRGIGTATAAAPKPAAAAPPRSPAPDPSDDSSEALGLNDEE